jgi:diaminopimelate decarboxylase
MEIKEGVLYFDGCNTVELAEKYGTPLYLISESKIISKCQELRDCFLNKYDNTRAAYAGKAFLTLSM